MKSILKKVKFDFSQYKYWKRTFGLIWKAAPNYTAGWAVLLILQGILPGLTVYLTKYVIDSIVAAKNSGGDWTYISAAIGFLVLTGIVLLLTEVFQSLGSWIRIAQAEYVGDYLTNKIHQKAAELDLAFYELPEYHDLMERARGDSSSKPLALLESFGSIIQNTITMLAMAAILISYGWWLPIVLLIGTLPALYISLYTDRIYHKWWKTTSDDRRWTNYYDAMLTHGDSATEMRLFDLSGHFSTLYQTIRNRLRVEKLQHLKKQSYGKVVAGIFALLTVVGAIGWMAMRVLYNLASLGDLGVFYQIFSRGQSLMGSLLGSVGKTVSNSLYLENLFVFLDLQSQIVSPENPHSAFSKLKHGINFKSVTFYYPNTKTAAIKDFNLFIPAGQVIALVGVNGAGKSTLIKLLNRFYDPTEGSIEIDGVDLRQFDVRELRQMMAVLFQFPMHYHAPASENIALGDVRKEILESEIKSASRRAGAHDFIMRLPQQYDTLLGRWFIDGMELSGGEWQRLALARAYFRQAPIVVLDEPTSFMDSWAEVDWFDRFRETTVGQTGVVITHRFTIAMRADIIHVIDRGKIIESGNHRELIKADGFYAESWKSQMQTAGERQIETEQLNSIESRFVTNEKPELAG